LIKLKNLKTNLLDSVYKRKPIDIFDETFTSNYIDKEPSLTKTSTTPFKQQIIKYLQQKINLKNFESDKDLKEYVVFELTFSKTGELIKIWNTISDKKLEKKVKEVLTNLHKISPAIYKGRNVKYRETFGVELNYLISSFYLKE